MNSIQNFSRVTGLIYLLVAILGAFGIEYVATFIVPDDINATIKNLIENEAMMRWAILAALFTQLGHLILVLMLHRILEPVNAAAAKLMVILVLVGVPIAMLNEASYAVILGLIETSPASTPLISALLTFHDSGIMIVQIFWGLWLFPFGYLVYKSDFLPKIIGVTLMVGCFGYLADSLIYFYDPQYPIKFTIYLFWGEIFILLWLLIRGVNVQKWNTQTDVHPEHS